jgi:predicted ATPase
MLTHLHVENFKAWKKLDIRLGRVTGLFGTNSSGKSSLLQFLLMLKQTKNATDRGLVLDFGGPEQLVNLGGYRDVIHAHDIGGNLSWKIDWSLRQRATISDPTKKRTDVLASDTKLSIESVARSQPQSNLLVSDFLEYGFGGFRFSIAPKKTGGTEFSLKSSSPPLSDFRFVRNKQRAWALPGPIKTHLFPDQAKTYYQNADFLSLFETEYEAMMDSIYYLGPLRQYPKREYPWSGISPIDVGLRGERTIEAILSATVRKETRNLRYRSPHKPFQELIAYWLKELGLIHEFKIEEIGENANLYRAVVKRDGKSTSALLTDVGFGVSQVLPALVLLYYVPEGSTVILEQPEIHLHPSVQSGLADVILTVAAARDLQVIVESHSEHMLRRFQRRVAEQSFSSEEIKLYFCNSVGGQSKLVDLNMDLFGEIENWPADFFGDEMTEIAETRKAILKRKMKSVKA